jgi:hypothetical protein
MADGNTPAKQERWSTFPGKSFAGIPLCGLHGLVAAVAA